MSMQNSEDANSNATGIRGSVEKVVRPRGDAASTFRRASKEQAAVDRPGDVMTQEQAPPRAANAQEEYDVDSFLINEAEHAAFGGRAATGGNGGGVSGALAKAIRDFAKAKDLVCFKIRTNVKSQLEKLKAGLIKKTSIELSTDVELEPAMGTTLVAGAAGRNSGALTHVFFPAEQMDKMKVLCKGDGEPSHYHMKDWRIGLEIAVTRERMAGAVGRRGDLMGLYGLRQAPNVMAVGSFLCKCAVVTQLVVEAWSTQFGKPAKDARFQVVSRAVGEGTGASGNDIQFYGDFVDFAEEAHEQRMELQQLDLDKLAEFAGLMSGSVLRATPEAILAKEVAKEETLKQRNSGDKEQFDRSIVCFNVKRGTTPEEATTAFIAAVATAGGDTLEKEDIEQLTVEPTQAGNTILKARFKSVEKMKLVYWQELSTQVQSMHDGGGPQGLKMQIDTPISERRKTYRSDSRRVSTHSGPASQVQRRGVWQGDQMPLDMPSLGKAIADKLAANILAAITKPDGAFSKAVSKAVATACDDKMMTIRNRLDSIEAGLKELIEQNNQWLPNHTMNASFDFGDGGSEMTGEEDSILTGSKRPGPDIHQVANEMAQQMTKKLFSGQALDQGQQAQNFKQGMNTQAQQQMLLRQLAAAQGMTIS